MSEKGVFGRASSRLREISGRGKYSVGFVELDGFGYKAVYKGTSLVQEVPTFEPLLGKQTVGKEFIPPFAKGECVIVGGGDYKIVMADQAGSSDYVIKLYSSHIYEGPNAKLQAELAASRIGAIYDVLREICGKQHLLPEKLFASPYSWYRSNEFCVYGVQQREVLVSPWLVLPPSEAERRVFEANKVWGISNKLALPALRERGLVHPADRVNGVGPTHFDLVSRNMVAIDVLDYVFVDTKEIFPHN